MGYAHTHKQVKTREPSCHEKKYQDNKCFYLGIYLYRLMSPLIYYFPSWVSSGLTGLYWRAAIADACDILFFFFKFYFIFKLCITVLDLPNIKINPPQVYMCSQYQENVILSFCSKVSRTFHLKTWPQWILTTKPKQWKLPLHKYKT